MLPTPPHLQYSVPDVVCDEQHLEFLEGGVQSGEVVNDHVIPVPDEFSIYQTRGGVQHDQGQFVVTSLQGQGDAKIVDDRTTINL